MKLLPEVLFLVGNYLYPACVADMVLRARIGTHEASP